MYIDSGLITDFGSMSSVCSDALFYAYSVSWYFTETELTSLNFLPSFNYSTLGIWTINAGSISSIESYNTAGWNINAHSDYGSIDDNVYWVGAIKCYYGSYPFTIVPHEFGYAKFNLESSELSFASPPEPIDGVCGADNGQITNQEPPVPPNVLCDAGTAGEVFFFENYWGWFCYGLNGGSPSPCQAFNTLPINGVCGADNGGTFTLPGAPEDLCSTGYVLDVSFVETTTGWTWACMGYQGGSNDYCDATKGSLTLPDLPEQEDCGSQSIPDKWLCEISNSLKSIFLPSASKITELQNVLNQANARFPFNYISRAGSRLQSLKNNTNSDTIEISILGNTGDINLDAVEPLAEKTKLFTSGLFVLGFIFWGVGYIKHFFK